VAAVDLAIDTTGSGLTVTTHADQSELCAAIVGSAELPAIEVMSKLVTALHAEAQALHVSAVVIDFTQLEFMNSSCFKCLVTWINDLSELPPAARYQVRFKTNPKILWQRRSLHALMTMATDIVSVET
jgi:hypothetical protein